jgi:KDO2-lipid IV(A) lauroyltransferase
MLKLILIPFSLLLNLVPPRGLDMLAKMVGWFLFRVIHFRRKTVIDNLERAFDSEKSKEDILVLAKQNYIHYAQTFLELIQSLVWSAEDFQNRTELSWEPAKEQVAKGEGGFLLTSHLGNWEFAIQSVSANGMPCDVIVKRQRTRFAQAFLEWYRQRFGSRVIFESGTTRDILRSLKENRFPVFVLDQFMGPPIGLPVKFFGQLAGTAVGLALLTEKKDTPLFTAYNYRDTDGKVKVKIEKVENEPQYSEDRDTRLYQKTQFYNDILERHIRLHPEQWLWIHRRWKPYRGTPRWSLASNIITCLVFILLQACSSQQMTATPTGIALPPDPTITVPSYGTDDSTEKSQSEPIPTKAPGILVPKPTAKPKKMIEKAQSPTKTFSIVPVDKVPFEVGEKMVIDLTWLALPAGKGTLEVRPGPIVSGRPTFHLWGNVLSSKMVDTIYHVDNTIESFIDQAGFIPYKFLLSMSETAQKKETRVAFDHPNSKAFYWSKRISQKWGDETKDKVDGIVPQSRDMFSAIYYARALNYELNRKQTFWVYENGQNLSVELLPLGREVVSIGAGVFQCWKIKVDIKLDNVLRPTGDLFLWLSDDSKKYVVKFDAKVKIGSLLGRLVSIKER